MYHHEIIEQDFTCKNSSLYTLEIGDLGDVHGRASQRAVAEYQAPTCPRMRVRHFNIAGVPWSNFKPRIKTNGRIAIINENTSIDVVNVGAGVEEALVDLRDDKRARLGKGGDAQGGDGEG